MFEVGVAATFEAAHTLRGDFGPAARLHGHTYRVEVMVRGTQLAADGTLVDLGLMRTAVDDVVAALHMRELEALEAFRDVNTTAERVAEHIAAAVTERLGAGVSAETLLARVWESPQAWAACERRLPAAAAAS